MQAIVVYGASGHGKVVAAAAQAAGWAVLGFADDRIERGVHFGLPVRPLEAWPASAAVALGVGHPRQRLALYERLSAAGRALPVVVHPQAHVEPTAQLEDGTIVMARAVVGVEVRVGPAVIVNTAAVVDHDSLLAGGVHVAPGATLAGGVRVGVGTMIGLGASVIQQVSLGAWTMVGAGAAVIADLPDQVVAVGVPARIVRETPYFE